jgi:hypothetical protein
MLDAVASAPAAVLYFATLSDGDNQYIEQDGEGD